MNCKLIIGSPHFCHPGSRVSDIKLSESLVTADRLQQLSFTLNTFNQSEIQNPIQNFPECLSIVDCVIENNFNLFEEHDLIYSPSVDATTDQKVLEDKKIGR